MAHVVIGMDPHKRSATIEVLDEAERLLATGRFGTDRDGYKHLLAAGRRWLDRVWAVEGCEGVGRHIAQRLVADGEPVVDVPAKLSAQARVFSTGQGRKTDATDAHSVALVALRTPGLRPVQVDGANRRINRVLHIMAIVQLRNDNEGRAYYRRKLAAGKTPMEAIRALKRRLSDLVYHQLVAEQKRQRQDNSGDGPGMVLTRHSGLLPAGQRPQSGVHTTGSSPVRTLCVAVDHPVCRGRRCVRSGWGHPTGDVTRANAVITRVDRPGDVTSDAPRPPPGTDAVTDASVNPIVRVGGGGTTGLGRYWCVGFNRGIGRPGRVAVAVGRVAVGWWKVSVSKPRAYSFGWPEDRSVIAGLAVHQVAIMAAGVLACLVAVKTYPSAVGLLIGAAALGLSVAVSVVPIRGQTVPAWLRVGLLFAAAWRRRRKGPVPLPVSGSIDATDPLTPPAMLRGVRIVGHQVGGHTVGVIADGQAGTWTALLVVTAVLRRCSSAKSSRSLTVSPPPT